MVWPKRETASEALTAGVKMAEPPAGCKHDWRQDPEGWKADVPAMEATSMFVGPRPDAVRKESPLIACARCAQWKKQWRETADVADWPPIETQSVPAMAESSRLRRKLEDRLGWYVDEFWPKSLSRSGRDGVVTALTNLAGGSLLECFDSNREEIKAVLHGGSVCPHGDVHRTDVDCLRSILVDGEDVSP